MCLFGFGNNSQRRYSTSFTCLIKINRKCNHQQFFYQWSVWVGFEGNLTTLFWPNPDQLLPALIILHALLILKDSTPIQRMM